MKRTGLLMLLAAFMISFGCQKEVTTQTMAQKQASVQDASLENAVWRTPNGYVIPYSERGNWENYLAEHLVTDKIDRKFYDDNACVPSSGGNCGLECVQVRKPGSCIAVSACAVCANCCTTTSF